jgi:fibronectin type 3 domain-containing protein
MREAGLVALLAASAAACGKIGPLKPPAPRGPLPASAVESRQIGDRVEIALTVPQPRGSETSQAVQRTEILRVAYPRGHTAPEESDALRVRGEVVVTVDAEYAKPGERIVIADPTVPQLADAGVGWTLRYGVRVRDMHGRPSPIVVAKDLTTVPAVPAPRALTGQASADGVRLAWEAAPGVAGATYNVYRGPADGKLSEHPLNVQPLSTLDDLDATVEAGKVYRYEVRAVAAEGTPYRESASSNKVFVDASDRFPPAPPTGLVAVQEGAAVRLLWNPGSESDLDGYRVYRQIGDGPFTRIGADVVRQPSFLDTGVAAGTVVRYRVTAIDRAVKPNESDPSSMVEVRIVAEPAAAPGTP